MSIEERVNRLEIKVYMIMGGIIVVAALSAILYSIAYVKFVKENNFEIMLLKAAKEHKLKGDPGIDGKDGISVPIAGVVAWPAPLPKENDQWFQQWRVCNGDEISLSEVSKEFASIVSDRYGKAEPGHIKLPNFSGYFLRGLDSTGKIDPDRKGRDVGTRQDDAIKKHTHPIRGTKENKANGGMYGVHVYQPVIGAKTQENVEGKDETRPKNIAVYWIIRVQ